MGTSFANGRLEIEMNLGQPAPAPKTEPDGPFRLLVAGDFSGRANRVVIEPVASKSCRRVDLDNFEQVLGSIGAALTLPLENRFVDLKFENLDGFHPDRLVREVSPLMELFDLRRKAAQGASPVALAQELQRLAPSATASDCPIAPAESSEQTLARLLGKPPAPVVQAPVTPAAAAVEQLLRNAVTGSAVAKPIPQQQALISAIDLELSNWMRAVLHHPALQALEAAWRGLDLLARSFGGEENSELYVADIAQHELAADAAAAETPEGSGFFRLLRSTAEAHPLALCAGLYEFRADISDLRLLRVLARAAARFSVPLVAQAGTAIVGCESFGTQPDPDEWKKGLPPESAQAWQDLRRSDEAAYMALGSPRFLLRQPYGARSDPIESFPFEEMPGAPEHEDYLWGNAAIACAYALARIFQQEGWGMRAEGWGELDGLPVHTFVTDGEKQVKPCAEAWLSDRAGEVLQARGMIPLLSVKRRDAVRVGRLQSMHEPATALRGRWR